MQDLIRAEGQGTLVQEDLAKFQGAFEKGQLLEARK